MLTEEATKNAFIMPFISNVLGYDVFDPSEVVPEFNADVGVKKGEKVDYAIFKDGQVQILMECKKIGDPLDLRYASQLFRYFAVTSARIAILTNGQQYHVYTDGDMPNRMDEKPFLIFDLLDIDRTLVPEIQKFSKESFDLDSVVSAAEELQVHRWNPPNHRDRGEGAVRGMGAVLREPHLRGAHHTTDRRPVPPTGR